MQVHACMYTECTCTNVHVHVHVHVHVQMLQPAFVQIVMIVVILNDYQYDKNIHV